MTEDPVGSGLSEERAGASPGVIAWVSVCVLSTFEEEDIVALGLVGPGDEPRREGIEREMGRRRTTA